MEKLLLNVGEVIEKYNELKNIHKVAKYFNVSVTPIRRILNDNGLKLTNRRYSVNHEYFNEIDNEEKAYWLGFIFADGYIRERKSGNSLEIKLSIKDKNHLELFKKCINSNHTILEQFNKVKYRGAVSKSQLCHLAVYSKRMVECIKKNGVHSRKTFTIERPNIEKELIRHFIRGYFDGDGSFSFKPKKYNKTQIISASKKFQDFIVKTLSEEGININLYSDIRLQIQNKIDNLKFYNYIYKNATIFLERKKQKYEEFREFYR